MISSDGIGGKTFSRNVSSATPGYPNDVMTEVIQSNISRVPSIGGADERDINER
jgi:hypothetical protein